MDDKDKKTISAEALYRSYQANRDGVMDVESVKNSPLNSSDQEPASEAESLYRMYRHTQSADSEAGSIDSLLQNIREEVESHQLPSHDQPRISDVVPIIDPVDATTGNVGGVGDATDSSKSQASSWFTRFTVGVAAAVLLAFVLIPQLIKTPYNLDNSIALLPTALSNDSARTMEFISDFDVSAYGFTSEKQSRQNAFNFGVLTADLTLTMENNNQNKTDSLLKHLLSILAMSSDEIPQATEIRTSIQTFGDAVKDDAPLAELKIHQNNLLSLLTKSVKENNQHDWYLAGHTVEAIRIAAEIALAHSEPVALEQALSKAQQLIASEEFNLGSESFESLAKHPFSGSEKYIQANSIKTMAEDIKQQLQ